MTDKDMQDPARDLVCYLVGGVVRDELLGRPVEDRDWVVVGAEPERMIALGFRAVGRDFPVFLHPHSGEEYALARTERKSGPGYRGFVVHAAPDVTLDDDLRRRDLTINAIAREPGGEVIDPYGGVADLERRILRHVSPAFVEDPVRVLRVARFAARFADLGFTVAEETMVLMGELADNGELDALTAERVWNEIQRALAEARPSVFFTTLRECGALVRLLPEIDALFGVPQQPDFHPEIDTGLHTMMAVDAAARLGADGETRFAALVHDLGKALTPAAELPGHRRHEQRGLPLVEGLCDRLRVPRSWRRLALAVCREHLLMHRLAELRAATVVDLLERLDAFRRPDWTDRFGLACMADAVGRSGREADPYPQRGLLAHLAQAARDADLTGVDELPADGDARAGFVRERRIAAVRGARKRAAGRLHGTDHSATGTKR